MCNILQGNKYCSNKSSSSVFLFHSISVYFSLPSLGRFLFLSLPIFLPFSLYCIRVFFVDFCLSFISFIYRFVSTFCLTAPPPCLYVLLNFFGLIFQSQCILFFSGIIFCHFSFCSFFLPLSFHLCFRLSLFPSISFVSPSLSLSCFSASLSFTVSLVQAVLQTAVLVTMTTVCALLSMKSLARAWLSGKGGSW